MFAFLAIALIAVGVGVVGWFQPLSDKKLAPALTFTGQQITDAKSSVCAAFQEVHPAVVVSSARSGSDPTSQLAVATSVRQAFDVGGEYLLAVLAEKPATPSDLEEAVRTLANLYQKLTVGLLAEVNDSDLDPLRRKADDTTSTIEGLCS